MSKKKRPGKRERTELRRAAQEKHKIIARNLAQPLEEVPRRTDIRTASTVLARADSFGWDYDSKGNVRNITLLVNPVGTKR